MKFEVDKYKMIRLYIISFLPFIASVLLGVIYSSDDGSSTNRLLWINVLLGVLISIFFFTIILHIFSFSIFVNHNLVYLMSEKINHRIIWDDVKEVYLGEYPWLKIKWLCFFHKDDDLKKHLVFRLSVLPDGDITKLLTHVKTIAANRSIEINY